MFGHRLAALALVPLVGAAQPALPPQLPLIDHVVVYKTARTILLYSEGRAVHQIEGIQLGDQALWPQALPGR